MIVDQAAGLRLPVSHSPRVSIDGGKPNHFVAVLSGKGGVGKTNLVANLAVAAAGLRRRVMVLDGDLGLANIDVLLGLVSRYNIDDVLRGTCTVAEALVTGPRGVRFLPAASGRSDLAALSARGLGRLMRLVRSAARDFDLVLIDAGAGIGPSVIGLTGACSRALVVTTPEPTSLADAYATLKVLRHRTPHVTVEIVVNAAGDPREARIAYERIDRMARRFLGGGIGWRGFLLRDPRLVEAVTQQRAVVELFPTADSSRRLVTLVKGLVQEHSAPR